MTAFQTPKEMFMEYQLDAHFNYMADRYDAERQAYKVMDEYANEAMSKIQHYADCIAESYLEGCKIATNLWKSKGLGLIHAYAVLNKLVDFLLEFEETEQNEPDYE